MGYDEYGRPSVRLEPRSREERRQLLAVEVRGLVAGGARLETQNEFEVVIASGKDVNHVAHAIVSVGTAFLWVPVWIILSFRQGVRRRRVSVDRYGQVLSQEIDPQ